MEKRALNLIEKREKALKISIKEGSASGFSMTLGDTYITPFALALKGSAFHIGILNAIIGLLSPIAQFFGSELMEKYNRKKIALNSTLFQAIIWIPIAILGYLFITGAFQKYLIAFLIILYSLLAIISGLAYPSWFSWMGDLVPKKSRGAYFSQRNKKIGIISLVATFIGAIVLDVFKTRGLAALGFTVIFLLASSARLLSLIFLKKQYEPKRKLEKNYYFSIWAFIKRMDNFGKFSIFNAFFNFAIMIASPFFAVYMLQELNFSYITYTLTIISSSIFYILFSPLAGKFSDKYGNKKLLYLSSILFSLNPLLWIFLKNPIALILLPQLIVGLANAAFVISVTNFTYDSVSPKHRGICVAYLNILTGCGIFLGSITGGILLKYLNISSINPFIIVFALAALLRLSISLFFMAKIKEVKKVKKIPSTTINLIHPIKSIYSEINWFRKISSDK